MAAPEFHFVEPKGVRMSVKNHILSGLTISGYLTFVREFAWDIAWITYAHRLAFLLFMAVINSVLAAIETVIYGPEVARTRVHPSPIFILGHPRTGTTHLHNLLSRDARFAYASTLDVGFPSSCVLLGARPDVVERVLGGMLDDTRPMVRLWFQGDPRYQCAPLGRWIDPMQIKVY